MTTSILDEYVDMLGKIKLDPTKGLDAVKPFFEKEDGKYYRTVSYGDYMLLVNPQKASYVLFSEKTGVSELNKLPAFTEIEIKEVKSVSLKPVPNNTGPNIYNVIELVVSVDVHYKTEPFFKGNAFQPKEYTLYMLPVNVSFKEVSEGVTKKLGSALGLTYTQKESSDLQTARDAFLKEFVDYMSPITDYINNKLPDVQALALKHFLENNKLINPDDKSNIESILTNLPNLPNTNDSYTSIKEAYTKYKATLNKMDTTDLLKNEIYKQHYMTVKIISKINEKLQLTNNISGTFKNILLLYKLLPDPSPGIAFLRKTGKVLGAVGTVAMTPLIATGKAVITPIKLARDAWSGQLEPKITGLKNASSSIKENSLTSDQEIGIHFENVKTQIDTYTSNINKIDDSIFTIKEIEEIKLQYDTYQLNLTNAINTINKTIKNYNQTCIPLISFCNDLNISTTTNKDLGEKLKSNSNVANNILLLNTEQINTIENSSGNNFVQYMMTNINDIIKILKTNIDTKIKFLLIGYITHLLSRDFFILLKDTSPPTNDLMKKYISNLNNWITKNDDDVNMDKYKLFNTTTIIKLPKSSGEEIKILNENTKDNLTYLKQVNEKLTLANKTLYELNIYEQLIKTQTIQNKNFIKIENGIVDGTELTTLAKPQEKKQELIYNIKSQIDYKTAFKRLFEVIKGNQVAFTSSPVYNTKNIKEPRLFFPLFDFVKDKVTPNATTYEYTFDNITDTDITTLINNYIKNTINPYIVFRNNFKKNYALLLMFQEYFNRVIPDDSKIEAGIKKYQGSMTYNQLYTKYILPFNGALLGGGALIRYKKKMYKAKYSSKGIYIMVDNKRKYIERFKEAKNKKK